MSPEKKIKEIIAYSQIVRRTFSYINEQDSFRKTNLQMTEKVQEKKKIEFTGSLSSKLKKE